MDDLTTRWIELIARMYWNTPQKQLFEELQELDASILPAGIRGHAVAIKECSGKAVESEEELLEIQIDYTSLFAGCVEGSPYPYESTFSGEERQLMMPVRDEVVAAYKDAGFSPADGYHNEPEDHISFELEFCLYLLEQKKGQELKTFVDQHLAKWVEPFCEEVELRASTVFYGEAAQLTFALVKALT